MSAANLTDTLAVALYKETISQLRGMVRRAELYRTTATEQRDASWLEADRLRVELHRGAVLHAALRLEIDELRRQLARFEHMT